MIMIIVITDNDNTFMIMTMIIMMIIHAPMTIYDNLQKNDISQLWLVEKSQSKTPMVV